MLETNGRPGLSLTRHAGEQIVVHVPGYAEPMIITVTSTANDRCRLNFAAPRCFEVNRREIDGLRRTSRTNQTQPPKPSADPFLPKSLDAIAADEPPEIHGVTQDQIDETFDRR